MKMPAKRRRGIPIPRPTPSAMVVMCWSSVGGCDACLDFVPDAGLAIGISVGEAVLVDVERVCCFVVVELVRGVLVVVLVRPLLEVVLAVELLDDGVDVDVGDTEEEASLVTLK